MKAMVWELRASKPKIRFKLLRGLEGFLWLLVGSFTMGMVSLFIASYLYVPVSIKVIDKIIAGLS